jgi:hypothetical protein
LIRKALAERDDKREKFTNDSDIIALGVKIRDELR